MAVRTTIKNKIYSSMINSFKEIIKECKSNEHLKMECENEIKELQSMIKPENAFTLDDCDEDLLSEINKPILPSVIPEENLLEVDGKVFINRSYLANIFHPRALEYANKDLGLTYIDMMWIYKYDTLIISINNEIYYEITGF